jgi:hypothetical protein
MPLRDNIFDSALTGLEPSMDVTPSNFLKPGDRVSTGALGIAKAASFSQRIETLANTLAPAVFETKPNSATRLAAALLRFPRLIMFEARGGCARSAATARRRVASMTSGSRPTARIHGRRPRQITGRPLRQSNDGSMGVADLLVGELRRFADVVILLGEGHRGCRQR